MDKFRMKSKPSTTVDAFRLGIEYAPDWFEQATKSKKVWAVCYGDEPSVDIVTPDGIIHVEFSDYIIRYEDGSLDACKMEYFYEIYESENYKEN